MRELLKDIATIGAGQGAPQGDSNYCDDGTPFVKAGNLQELIEGKDINDIQQVSEEVAKKHKLKIYPRGTILFAKSGMSCMKGYVYVLPQACITPNEDCSEYLRYYFTFHRPNQLVKDAAYPSISLSDIGDLEIDMKSQSERTEIVDQLKHIESIIALRQEELSALDDLIKARFVELLQPYFDSNETEPLIDLVDEKRPITYGILKPGTDTENGYPVIRVKDFSRGLVSVNEVLHTTKEIYSKYLRSTLEEGDIIISIGGTIGRIAIIPTEFVGANITQHTARVALRDKRYLSYYKGLLESDIMQRWMKSRVLGVAQPSMNLGDVKKMPIPIVDESVMKELNDFVKQVDKSKIAAQKALDEAQLLFNSLMQQYFG